MAVKNTIGSTGFVTTKLASGRDQLDLGNAETINPPLFKVSSGSISLELVDPVTTIPKGVTASLPSLSNAIVGRQFILVMTASGPGVGIAADSMLSGTNMINGGAWTRQLSGSMINQVMWIFATKTPAGLYNWVAASGSAV